MRSFKNVLVKLTYNILLTSNISFASHCLIIIVGNNIIVPYILIDKYERIFNLKTYIIKIYLKNLKIFYIEFISLDELLNFCLQFESQIEKTPAYIFDKTFDLYSLQSNPIGSATNLKYVDWNNDYDLCYTYPKQFYVPSQVTKQLIKNSSLFRQGARFPIVCYTWGETGYLIRSSQPIIGTTLNYSKSDEEYLNSFLSTGRRGYIVDTRSSQAIQNAKITGGGSEHESRYPQWKKLYIGLDHTTFQQSYKKLVTACLDQSLSIDKWISQMEASNWLESIQTLLNYAKFLADVIKNGSPILIHGSNGTDVTLQLTSLIQIILEPECRTFKGFESLIQREWVDGGHPFRDRCRTGPFADTAGNNNQGVLNDNSFPGGFTYSNINNNNNYFNNNANDPLAESHINRLYETLASSSNKDIATFPNFSSCPTLDLSNIALYCSSAWDFVSENITLPNVYESQTTNQSPNDLTGATNILSLANKFCENLNKYEDDSIGQRLSQASNGSEGFEIVENVTGLLYNNNKEDCSINNKNLGSSNDAIVNGSTSMGDDKTLAQNKVVVSSDSNIAPIAPLFTRQRCSLKTFSTNNNINPNNPTYNSFLNSSSSLNTYKPKNINDVYNTSDINNSNSSIGFLNKAKTSNLVQSLLAGTSNFRGGFKTLAANLSSVNSSNNTNNVNQIAENNHIAQSQNNGFYDTTIKFNPGVIDFKPNSRNIKYQEICPSFLIFLDCVLQILYQFPTSFEFNTKYILTLFEHAYASPFNTFNPNKTHLSNNLNSKPQLW